MATGITDSQITMLVLAVGGLSILMISTYRRIRRRQQAPRSTVRATYTTLQRESHAKRDAERVMVELDQLARQIHGRIDTRFAKLEAVIRDADERIDQLTRLMQRADGEPTVDVTLASEEPEPPSNAPVEEVEGRHTAIYRLADGGLPVTEIAREVGKTSGEVELILALRRTGSAGGNPTETVSSKPQS